MGMKVTDSLAVIRMGNLRAVKSDDGHDADDRDGNSGAVMVPKMVVWKPLDRYDTKMRQAMKLAEESR